MDSEPQGRPPVAGSPLPSDSVPALRSEATAAARHQERRRRLVIPTPEPDPSARVASPLLAASGRQATVDTVASDGRASWPFASAFASFSGAGPAASPTVQALRQRLPRRPTVRHISTRKEFSTNPIRKFLRYGRFPFKLGLNVVLTALMIAFSIACDLRNNTSEEEQRQTLIRTFMPALYSDPAVDYVRYPLYVFADVNVARDFMRQTTERYYDIVRVSPAHYSYLYDQGSTNTDKALAPVMHVTLRGRTGRLSANDDGHSGHHMSLTRDRPFGFFAPVDARLHNGSAGRLAAACLPREDFSEPGLYYAPCAKDTLDTGRFDVVRDVEVEIHLSSVCVSDPFTHRPMHYIWRVQQRYDLTTNGIVTLTLTITSDMHRNAESVTPWMVVAIVACIVALWDFLLRCKALVKIREMARIRQRAEERRQRRLHLLNRRRQRDMDLNPRGSSTESTDGSCTSSTSTSSASSGSRSSDSAQQRVRSTSQWKTDLRNNSGKGWTVWAMTADLLALVFCVEKLIGSTTLIVEPSWLRYTMSSIGGLALLGLTSLLASYVRFFPNLYTLFICTDVAAPHLGNFLVAVLPVFFGFALFANIAFGAYAPEFSTLLESCTSQYAAIFGDSLLQAFQVVAATDNFALKWAGRIYAFCFISLFIYAVFNIATSIIMLSYAYVRERFAVFQRREHRRVNMRKTRKEQLEEAIGKAEEALFEVAALMSGPRAADRELQAPDGHSQSDHSDHSDGGDADESDHVPRSDRGSSLVDSFVTAFVVNEVAHRSQPPVAVESSGLLHAHWGSATDLPRRASRSSAVSVSSRSSSHRSRRARATTDDDWVQQNVLL